MSGTVRGVGGPAGAAASAAPGTLAVTDAGGHVVAQTRLDGHGGSTVSPAPGRYRLSFRDTTAPCPGTEVVVGTRGQVVDVDCPRK